MTPDLIPEADGLRLRWPDGVEARCPYLWLRDADPAGFHPQTGERVFDLAAVPSDLAAEEAVIDDGALVLRWPGAAAPSRFDLGWLHDHHPGVRRPDPAAVARQAWRGDFAVPRVPFAEIMGSDAALRDWLIETKRTGLSVVTRMADDPEAGVELARRVGFLRETNFGVVFEVMTKPDPNNLAYTAEALPLHTDLPNQELMPGYQFLHCLANAARGGGSVFCDGVAVAEDFRAADPAGFDLLASARVPFRFYDATCDLRSRRTIIEVEDGAPVAVSFSQHLGDVVDLPAEEMAAFYAAYLRFTRMLRAPDYAVETRLEAGEAAVFDNRRILHGRAAFDPSTGRRHLRGYYVDHQEWDSRLRVLSR